MAEVTDRIRRKPVRWWECDPPAWCQRCEVPLDATSTPQVSEDTRIQYRKCPECGETRKVALRA